MKDCLDACLKDLYSPDDYISETYPADIAEKLKRVRTMHQWWLSNAGASDAECVRENISRHQISKPTAYSDLRILKVLLPMLSDASKEFHRWRYEQMILDTYNMAKNRKDTRTMERAASSYAKYTRIDEEDSKDIPIEKLIPQRFIPTDDPSVLGIKKIPNLRERQRQLIEKYTRESADIQDIDYEETDLMEDELFEPLS